MKLFLSHGKMECKRAFRHVPHQTRCVYQDSLLSELHNSCSCLEERSKICNTTQKPQNFILSAFLKMHRRQECANPGCLVAGVTMLRMAEYYYLQHKHFNMKLRISSNVTNINHHVRPKRKCYFRIVRFLYGNCFTANFQEYCQFWNREIMCIYTNTFLQIAHPLGLNLRFVFVFGELQRYEILLDYQESSNLSRTYC